MPYYHWKGVDLVGNWKTGRLFARSPEHLDELLLRRHIALITSKPQKHYFVRPISLDQRLAVFQQLSTLLDSGVIIPDALLIIASQLDHSRLQDRMDAVAHLVQSGYSLSEALYTIGDVANPIMLQLIKAGEESGKLPQTLHSICDHLAATKDFYSRLRSALLLPAITLLFFLGIILIIFIVILPRFVDIFATMHAKVPPATQALLSISAWLKSPLCGLLISSTLFVLVLTWRISKKGRLRTWRDMLVVRIPIVGTIMRQRFLSYSMRALSVLLESGMPLSQGLSIVKQSVSNQIFKLYLATLERDIDAGSSLSDAMGRSFEDVFSPDIIAMVEVGQESGKLPLLLNRIAMAYHERVMQKLSRLTLLVQPAVMILLGLLVSSLVFAIYGPILNMARLF